MEKIDQPFDEDLDVQVEDVDIGEKGIQEVNRIRFFYPTMYRYYNYFLDRSLLDKKYINIHCWEKIIKKRQKNYKNVSPIGHVRFLNGVEGND